MLKSSMKMNVILFMDGSDKTRKDRIEKAACALRDDLEYYYAIYGISVAVYIRFMLVSGSYSSMDFRYVLYLIPVEALMAGIWMKGRNDRLIPALGVLTLAFTVSATAVYLMLSMAG